jgi:hypothetical protein
MRPKRRRSSRVAALLVAVMMILAACGGSDSEDTMGAADTAAEGVPANTTVVPSSEGGDNDAAREPEAPGLGSGGVGQPTQAPITTNRDIIFTARLTVSVDDVAAATAEAVQIVESFQGFVFGQDTVAEPEPTTVLTFKVPPEQFQEVLAALGDVGEIRNQTVSAEDVTDRIVDLQSRISTAETSVERLRTLLENADAIKTITELEAQLLERETTLEVLRGQLRTVRDQVSLATITVQITQAAARPEIDVRPTAYLGFDDDGASCPGDAGIRVVEGETVTFCLEITNVGDTLLTEIEVKDAVLGKDDAGDFILVFGELDRPLEPGQSIVLATSVDVERTLRTQTRVTATPLTEEGTAIEGRTVSNTSTITLAAEDPGGIPSFGEGLERSWEALVNLAKLLILGVGIAIPFIWVLGLIWLYLRWRSRRDAERAAEEERRRAAMPPPAADAPLDEPAEEAGEVAEDDWELEDDV